MDNRTKRIVIIIGISVASIFLAWLLWFLFLTPSAPVEEPEPIDQPTTTAPRAGGLPSAPSGAGGVVAPPTGITPGDEATPPGFDVDETVSPIATGGLTQTNQLTNQATRDVHLANNGRDLQFYDPELGRFYRVNAAGETTLLTEDIFRDVDTVTWNPSGTQAILEFPDGANIMYDFATDRQVTLPAHWEEFNFSPQGDEIAFKSMGFDPNDRWLAIARPDGSGARIIEEMGENSRKFEVNWSPNQQIVATFVESRDGVRQELFFIGQNRENFRLATLEGRQFVGQWAPEGDRMLYSVYSPISELKPSLWIVDAAPGTTGENRQHLNVQTWADKCVYSGDNINLFCAVPKTLPRGAGITRDAVRDTPDNFFRINTRTGSKQLIAIPATDMTAENIILSENESTLSFLDRGTGTVQEIRLK